MQKFGFTSCVAFGHKYYKYKHLCCIICNIIVVLLVAWSPDIWHFRWSLLSAYSPFSAVTLLASGVGPGFHSFSIYLICVELGGTEMVMIRNSRVT